MIYSCARDKKSRLSQRTIREPKVAVIFGRRGESTRLGQPKQLLQFHGKTLLQRAVDAASKVVFRRESDSDTKPAAFFAAGSAIQQLRSIVPGRARPIVASNLRGINNRHTDSRSSHMDMDRGMDMDNRMERPQRTENRSCR